MSLHHAARFFRRLQAPANPPPSGGGGSASPRSSRDEIRVLETPTGTVFKPPPAEWVTTSLSKLQDLLERETGRSAILLRQVLGPVILKPIRPDVGKAFYQAETTLQVIDLIDDPEDGSNWLRKWRRGELNRTCRDREGESGRKIANLGDRLLLGYTAMSYVRSPEGRLHRRIGAGGSVLGMAGRAALGY